MVRVKEDLTGRVFERLTVLYQIDDYVEPSGKHRSQWKCMCACGNYINVTSRKLLTQNTKSCGCLRMEMCQEKGRRNKKYNKYDISGFYGIGWTHNTNQEFYFDLEDYDKIKDYCWNAHEKLSGYQSLEAKDLKSDHIVLFTTVLGCKWYDHINRNPFDNRRENLRKATSAENSQNKSQQCNNTSGVTGVSFDKRYQRWYARITCNNKDIFIGSFINKEDAVRARLMAEQEYFGEFAPQQHLYEQYGIEP